ncbi:hypothetical protein [Dongia sp.]|uniref:hypothetical protein n=1 Tax=Dongia sp. TaxID=1977262 RepID=UPI003753DAF0
MGTIPGYNEFELDIERVLREQLADFFGQIDSAPLTQANIQTIPAKAKGAYILLHKGVPVYAGKTDTRHGFRNRLDRHWFTLQHRKGLDIADMSFKAVRVMVFSNFDVEAILIERMRAIDPNYLEWNDSGFGSNDPGRNRDGQAPADIDEQWPIDLDMEIDPGQKGPRDLLGLLIQMKDNLPYTFRYDTDLIGKKKNGKPLYAKYTVGHKDYQGKQVMLPHGTALTFRDVLKLVVAQLPGWQATVFSNRVILYPEHENYPYAKDIIR